MFEPVPQYTPLVSTLHAQELQMVWRTLKKASSREGKFSFSKELGQGSY